MEYEYFSKTSATNLVKTIAFMAVSAVSLIPSSNYQIPNQTSTGYEDYAKMGTYTSADVSLRKTQREQAEILLSFADKLIENTRDLDVEIAQIINNDFWEMYD